MKKHISIVLLFCGWSVMAQGAGIDRVSALTQTQFKDLSLDLAAASSYKSVSAAAGLGVVGFDVGMAVTATKVEHSSAWTAAMSNSSDVPTVLYVPKLYVRKGLPFGIDVGAHYFSVPSTNIESWGAEVSYEVIDGGVIKPSVGVGLTYSRLFIDKDLELATRGIEAKISKGFVFITPYAGIGRQWSESTPKGAAAALKKETFSDNRYFVGLTLNPGVIQLAIEHDSVGGVTSNSLKLGMKF
ncbi:MAG: hypothetical protein HY272_12380 [Gammaproteobacteria bacterium]|nr:hypothetical protein [Gammaproteobacteria bacterium]